MVDINRPIRAVAWLSRAMRLGWSHGGESSHAWAFVRCSDGRLDATRCGLLFAGLFGRSSSPCPAVALHVRKSTFAARRLGPNLVPRSAVASDSLSHTRRHYVIAPA